MFGFLFRLVFGSLAVLFGASIMVWVLYNYLVERRPEFSGPKFFTGFGAATPMLTVGIYWLRHLKPRRPDEAAHSNSPDDSIDEEG